MANWPPTPNEKKPDNNEPNNQNGSQGNQQRPHAPTGQEWKIIETTMLASIEEQRKSRRWNIFFKVLTFGYLFIILLTLGKGCSHMPNSGDASAHIAIVNVKGVIQADGEVNSARIGHAVKEAFEAKNSKAVVLNINSPGGSPVQSDEIWQRIRKLKEKHKDKKIYAYIGDMGASGAYYIASATDEIWVNKSSLVGSIGVIMPNYELVELAKKLGVKDRTMTAGDHKSIMSMTKQIDEFERQHVQGVLDNVHQHFIDAVKAGRGDKLKDVEGNRTFSGLFWSGDQAVKLGLADKIGGIRDIAEIYKTDEFVNYTPTDPMEELLKGLSLKMGQGIGSEVGTEVFSKATQNSPKLQ